MSDSICKYITQITNGLVWPFRGYTAKQVEDALKDDPSLVEGADIIIVHVGTNDVQQEMQNREVVTAGVTVSDVVTGSVLSLSSVVSDIKPTAVVCYSSILPRPVDYDLSKDVVIYCNSAIKAASTGGKFWFWPTYKPFIKNGVPRRELFAVLDGGLHLRKGGWLRLRQSFMNFISMIARSNQGE